MHQDEPFHSPALVPNSSKALCTGICLKVQWMFGVKLRLGQSPVGFQLNKCILIFHSPAEHSILLEEMKTYEQILARSAGSRTPVPEAVLLD